VSKSLSPPWRLSAASCDGDWGDCFDNDENDDDDDDDGGNVDEAVDTCEDKDNDDVGADGAPKE
jgi:hypothetical protein